MPKQIKELKTFITGTITTPSAEDVQPEASVYSKNLEPLDEQGKLKGIKQDLKVKPANEGFSLVAYQIPSQGIFVTGDTDVTYTEDNGSTTTLEPEGDATTTYYDESHNISATPTQITMNKDIDADSAAANGRTYTEVYSLKSGDNIKVYNEDTLLGEADYKKTIITGQIGTSSPGTTTNKTADASAGGGTSPDDDVTIGLPVDQFNEFTSGQTVTVKDSSNATLDGSSWTYDEATQTVVISGDVAAETYTVSYTQTPVEVDAPYPDNFYNWDGSTPRNKTSLKVRIYESGGTNGFINNGLTVSDDAEDTPIDTLKGRIIQITSGTYEGAWAVIKSNSVRTITLVTNQGLADEAVDNDNVDIGWYWDIEHTPLQFSTFDHTTLNDTSAAKWENDVTFQIVGGNNETWQLLKESLESHESIIEANLLTSEEDDPSDFGAEESGEDEDDTFSETKVLDLLKALTYGTDVENNDFSANVTGWAGTNLTPAPDGTEYYDGSQSMKLTQTGADGHVIKTIPTTADKWQYISFWAYKDDITNNVKYALGTSSGGEELISYTDTLSTASLWTKVELYIKGTGNSVYLSINPGGGASDHVCYID